MGVTPLPYVLKRLCEITSGAGVILACESSPVVGSLSTRNIICPYEPDSKYVTDSIELIKSTEEIQHSLAAALWHRKLIQDDGQPLETVTIGTFFVSMRLGKPQLKV